MTTPKLVQKCWYHHWRTDGYVWLQVWNLERTASLGVVLQLRVYKPEPGHEEVSVKPQMRNALFIFKGVCICVYVSVCVCVCMCIGVIFLRNECLKNERMKRKKNQRKKGKDKCKRGRREGERERWRKKNEERMTGGKKVGRSWLKEVKRHETK